MKPARPDDLRQALALIRATHAHARRMNVVQGLLDSHANLMVGRYNRQSAATDFHQDPNRLADAIPLVRRFDAEFRHMVEARYRLLLQDMKQNPITKHPFRIDLHGLEPAARPYVLMPFLGLEIADAYPRLCLATSDPPAGRLTYIAFHGAVDPAAILPHLPKVSAWLGGRWTLAAHTATTFTLVRQAALPPLIRLDPRWLRAGSLLLGLDGDTGQPVHLPFERMTHLLVAGTPGMGKSQFLHTLLRSCLHSANQFHAIHAICGQGIAFESYRGLHPKLIVADQPESLPNIARSLQETMRERVARLVAQRRDKMADYILVVIDEWGAFNNPERPDKATREAHAQFLQDMMHLGKRGRKVGIRLVIVVQEPVERDLAPGLKATLPGILSFRLPVATHATALFGEITPPAVPIDPRTLPVGHALFHDGLSSERRHLRIPLSGPPDYRP